MAITQAVCDKEATPLVRKDSHSPCNVKTIHLDPVIWMTHTDYISIRWRVRPTLKPQKSNQWLLTTDVTLIPQTAFLWWFPPPTVMIQQSAHSKLFELTMRYINFSGFAWVVSLTALALKNAQNQSVADMFHSNEWHIPIGSDRKSGGWGGCWVSCNVELHVGKT